MIDQRFIMHDTLRGYALHYLVRLGIFDNMLSREHAIPADAPAKTFTRENKGKWVLKEYEITPMQLAELDECYDDMMKFVERNYNK